MLAALTLASLVAPCSRLAQIARTRMSQARWRRLSSATVAPSAAPSPPVSPPEHAGAPSTAADDTMPGLIDMVDVEDGGDWQVVRDFAAAHGQLEALNAFLEYAKGAVLHAEDIVGPENLEGIARETKRKLLHFEGRPELAELAMQLARLVLPHVGLEGRPVGITRGDGSVAGVSLIVTLPGAERQPSHLDANVEDVYSVIVPLSQRRLHVVSRQEPIVLGPGDALVFKASELCHGGDGLGQGEDMRCALFFYVGHGVTEDVVDQSFECEWRSTKQWAQALPTEGLVAALRKPEVEKVGEVVAELHGRLLAEDAAQRPRLEAEAAATVLRGLRKVAGRVTSPSVLAEVGAGRWPPGAPIMLYSARLAVAVADTLDRGTTDVEELMRDITHALAPALRPMTDGALHVLRLGGGSEKLKVRPARMMTCDAIAGLLEWGRLRMPDLATDVDGPLVHLVGYYLWTVDSIPADEEYARHREAAVRGIWDMQIDLREACARETAPRVEVAGLKYPLLWQPAYSPSMRSLERELAAGFRPGGIEREEAGRALLSEFMLISTRLVSIGWSRIRAAATAATAGDDNEEARRMGTTFGMVLTQARDRAEQRMAALRQARDEAGQSTGGQAASTPGWEDTALETMVGISGALHVFADRARKYDHDKRRGKGAPAFWEAFVAATKEGMASTPPQSLSEAQQKAGARLQGPGRGVGRLGGRPPAD